MNRIQLAALNGSKTALKTLEVYQPIQHLSMQSKGTGKSYEDSTNYGYRGKK